MTSIPIKYYVLYDGTDYGYDILIVIRVKPLARCAFTHLPITPNLKTVYFPRFNLLAPEFDI
jgi:hypothetical protein